MVLDIASVLGRACLRLRLGTSMRRTRLIALVAQFLSLLLELLCCCRSATLQ